MTSTATAALSIETTSAGDPEWDSFVAATVGGHHVQTCLWAQVKATMGWDAVRITARRSGTVVAGAQILHRPVRGVGRVGYVAYGPVVAPGEDDAGEAVVDGIEQYCRRHRVRHLTIQPPGSGTVPARPDLRGHLPGSTHVAPRSTLLLDLEPSVDELLAEMHRKTRYNVRVSGRKDVEVRPGDAGDVALFHRMLEATGARQGFAPFPRSYYEAMYRLFTPGGHVRLSVAEYAGTPVAAQMMIGFGDTAVNKFSVWSGAEGSRRPNEAIQWAAIRWAKEQGYRWYDFEGIDLEAARLLQAGQSLPDSFDQTVTSYKLGYGGVVAIAPEPSEFVYGRATRWAFGEVYPRVRQHPRVKHFVKRLRTKGA